jgi:uncharacterized phage-like protein YoqJ
MIVAGTGHRPDKLGGYSRMVRVRLTQLARDGITSAGATSVISGMALGWDQAVAMAAYLEGIPFVAAIPFKGFEGRWPLEAQSRFWWLADRAKEVRFLSPYAGNKALMDRNKWMADRADLVLALWDGSITGGTANTVVYCEKKKIPMQNLWPRWDQTNAAE